MNGPTCVLCLLLVLASPTIASAIEWNVLVGVGFVGPAQYDQGMYKPMMTVNASGFFRVGEKASFGGAGVAVRATHGPDRIFVKGSFDEFGLAVPFFTYRWGRVAGQIGVEIQRANLQKNFYYMAFGLSFGGRRPRDQSRGPNVEPAPE